MQVRDQLRESRREHTVQLGKEVMMLSTKCDRNIVAHIHDEERELNKLIRELQATQK